MPKYSDESYCSKKGDPFGKVDATPGTTGKVGKQGRATGTEAMPCKAKRETIPRKMN